MEKTLMRSKNKILYLTLHWKWFEMIAKGIKLEEYREINNYWRPRLTGHNFTHVQFRNGYHRDAPVMLVKITSINIKTGLQEWGAEPQKKYFTIELGQVIEVKNCHLTAE